MIFLLATSILLSPPRKDSQAEGAKPTKQAIWCYVYSYWILADPCFATPTIATKAIIGQVGLTNATSTKGRHWQLMQKKCRRIEKVQWYEKSPTSKRKNQRWQGKESSWVNLGLENDMYHSISRNIFEVFKTPFVVGFFNSPFNP